MQDDLKKILSKSNDSSDPDTVLKYLNEELSNAAQHDLEKLMLDDDFANDAVEGLQEVQNKEKLTEIVHTLNRDLKKRIAKKAKVRSKLDLHPQWWLYFSVLLLLLIIVLFYLYIHANNN